MYPRVNTNLVAGIDYSLDGPAAEEICYQCGNGLGDRAVGIERDASDIELICGDCHDNPKILAEVLQHKTPTYW